MSACSVSALVYDMKLEQDTIPALKFPAIPKTVPKAFLHGPNC